MAAISPFNFLAAFDKSQAPELISPDQTMPAFEDALASMLGSHIASANDAGPTPMVVATELAPGPPAAPRAPVAAQIAAPLSPLLSTLLSPSRGSVPRADDSEDTAETELLVAPALVDASPRFPASDVPRDGDDVEDESLLVNPQASFVTLPWLPPADRDSFPVLASSSAPPVARANGDAASPGQRVPPDPRGETAPAPESVRRSTLRFPPPTLEAMPHATRELGPMKAASPRRATQSADADARPAEKPAAHAPDKPAPPISASHATPHSAARQPLELGFVVAPTSIEGGRVEWTIDTPSAPANDSYRSMSYAVAAAEHEQRTLRSDGDRPAAKRDRATAAAPAAGEIREPIEAAERPRAVEPSAEIARASELVSSVAPDAPPPIANGNHAHRDGGIEQRMAATVAALPDHRIDASVDPRSSEASRARRQDDAEVAVSQMTLTHRVEARTVVDDLGAITVRAESRNGQVEVSVAADRGETALFLDQNRADLTRDLKISAPTVSDVSVRTGNGGGGSPGFDQRSTPDREQQRQRHAHDEWAAGTPSSMAAATGVVPRVGSASSKRVRIVL
jgi:hypothetical protein